MAGITYMWLEYVMAVEQVPHRNRPINKFAVVFPFLVSTIALVITYVVAPHILLSDTLQAQPAFYAFLITVPCVNIAAVIIYTTRLARKVENPIEKRRHLYIGLFPLLVVVGGMLEILVLPNTPIFCFSSTLLMLALYIQSMEDQISIDPLTKLNNRGQLIRYISQKSNAYKEGHPTFVVMIDVNGFKRVNDTYGHAEGDRALTIVADSLKDVVRSRNAHIFLGRYGGDEFILIVHPQSADELDDLIHDVRETIVSKCEERNTPYVLSVGAGYDEMEDAQDTLQRCIQRADKKLYLDKAAAA